MRVLLALIVFFGFSCGSKPQLPTDWEVEPTPAWGETKGNSAVGKQLAIKLCASCHLVDGQGKELKGAPEFDEIANRQGMTAAYLKVWLKNPTAMKKGTVMPNLGLSDQEMDHLISYLYGLRKSEPN